MSSILQGALWGAGALSSVLHHALCRGLCPPFWVHLPSRLHFEKPQSLRTSEPPKGGRHTLRLPGEVRTMWAMQGERQVATGAVAPPTPVTGTALNEPRADMTRGEQERGPSCGVGESWQVLGPRRARAGDTAAVSVEQDKRDPKALSHQRLLVITGVL